MPVFTQQARVAIVRNIPLQLSFLLLGAALTGSTLTATDHRTFSEKSPAIAISRTEPISQPVLQEVSTDLTDRTSLAQFLAKRYRISLDATLSVIHNAFAAGHRHSLDPLLILAVIGVESSFNPLAESVKGAKGLMQIIPRFHAPLLAKSGGENAVLEPEVNIHAGAKILKEYISRTGDLVAGLQLYNGAPHDENARYATKVLAEQERLKKAAQRTRQLRT
jgi:soluble lytic murein transglycosylase-like protein